MDYCVSSSQPACVFVSVCLSVSLCLFVCLSVYLVVNLSVCQLSYVFIYVAKNKSVSSCIDYSLDEKAVAGLMSVCPTQFCPTEPMVSKLWQITYSYTFVRANLSKNQLVFFFFKSQQMQIYLFISECMYIDIHVQNICC